MPATFGLGSTGDKVREIQRLLQIADDGVYGPQTAAAVRDWQSRLQIGADGIWGSQTQEATDNLFNYLGGLQGPAQSPITPVTPSPPVAPPAAPGTTEQKNALSYINTRLQEFGLLGMSDKVWAFIVESGGRDDNQTMLWLYQQPEFKARFPALEALQKRYQAVTPTQYIQLERDYREVMRGAGLSANFFDEPNDFTSLIENDVSQAEFQERVNNGFQKVATADPTVRNAFRQYFGVEGDAALAAFFIDPDRSAPKLAKAAQMAELGGAASSMGVQMNADYAAKLTNLGVSQQQALAGFRKMQQQKGLFAGNINETAVVTAGTSQFNAGLTGTQDTSAMSTTDQMGIDYTFGTNVGVERQLEQRLAKRRAEASGVSQQVSTNRQGQTALGTAQGS